MNHIRLDNLGNEKTVNDRLKSAGAGLELAATELADVLTSLKAIMPCLPGSAPLKAEHDKIKKAEKRLRGVLVLIDEIRQRLPEDALTGWEVFHREGTD